MNTSPSVHTISFDKLVTFFTRQTDDTFILNPCLGNGFVKIYSLEKGLRAYIWNFRLNGGMEIYNDAQAGSGCPYFSIAFFLTVEGLHFAGTGTAFRENTVWDMLFISATADYRMHIAPMARAHCLSISFSKRWLDDNIFNGNKEFKNLKKRLYATESVLLLDSMEASEKKLMPELLDAAVKKAAGSFFVKSNVLKITSDFFYRIKERQTFGMDAPVDEVEKFLSNHLIGKLPAIKEVARRFSVSESTLKRHFKKRYGVNISTYFIHKKMAYARQLIHGKKINIVSVANMLGYKNVTYFIMTFKKYNGSLPFGHNSTHPFEGS